MEARWRALAILTTARTSLGFQFQSLASVSPMLVPELGLSYGDLGFLIGLYFLPGVVLALPAGAIGRRFGDKRIVLVGLAMMAAGGAVTGLAGSSGTLAHGRALSGAGAILLNVLMSKMVTDWFAGREIVLAMSIFVNAFPIGMGLAMLSLGWLAAVAGWGAALLAAAAFAMAAAALVAGAYAPHPNDGRGAAGSSAGTGWPRGRELALVCLAGAMWGIYNGGFGAMFGFAPTFLAGAGLSVVEAGLVVGATTWMIVASVQAGGIVAQKWGRPAMLMTLGIVAWTACLVALGTGRGSPVVWMICAGLLMGLPAGVIMSLPAQVLRPENRAVGMGVFYVCLYVGHGGLPALVGRVQDHAGSAAAAFHVTAAFVLSILVLFAIFRIGAARVAPSGGDPVRGLTRS